MAFVRSGLNVRGVIPGDMQAIEKMVGGEEI
jgi:hypothetical protein